MRWSDLIGLEVGPYTIGAEIGRGGAARVFRAFDRKYGREVAFKALPIETDDHSTFKQRFDREAAAIQQLSHPNIVQVYDVGERDEFVYLVLRLLTGGTLRQRIATQRISTQELCQYMIQIALALHHAHQLGIIHRDVKPSNMLLDTEQPGHILLTDFGTAKILTAQGLTRTGATIGTPEYMSPEQAEGREVDQRSDIYSLGCAMYEALAGRPPFVGATSVSVLYQQVHAQPTYIRSYNAEAPREFWAVLHTCLAKRPEDRYPSAERLAEALQPFADGLIQPTPAPWTPPMTGRLIAEGASDAPSRPVRATQTTPFTPAYPLALRPEGTPPGSVGPIPLALEGANREEGVTGATGAMGTHAPTSRPTFSPRGARPTLRLPANSGKPGLLSQDSWQAVSAFGEQIEAEERPSGQATQSTQVEQGLPFADIYPTAPTPTPDRASAPDAYRGPPSDRLRAPNSGPNRVPAGGSGALGQMASAPYDPSLRSAPAYSPASGRLDAPQRAPNSGPRRSQTSGPISDRVSGPLSDPLPPTRRATASIPVDLTRLRADLDPTTLGRKRRRRTSQRRVWAFAALALIVVVAGALAFSVGGRSLFAQPGAAPQRTPAPTATTPPPTPTATVAQPTATATQTAQQQLNSQAANAFRAITIAPFSDGRCSSANMTTTFTSGESVFVNLCLADAAAPGPITAQVRQNGAVVRTLISNLSPSTGASYTQGHTLSPGSYDLLVTMRIGGKQAVAQDIPFTVR